LLFIGPLQGQERVDPSTLEYQKGIDALFQRNLPLARKHLEQSIGAGGGDSELARLALVEPLAKTGSDAEIGQFFQTATGELAPSIWYYGIEALMEAERLDLAASFAAEFVVRFPDSTLADNVEFALAEIFFQKNDLGAAFYRLTHILEVYPAGDFVDDACYLLSRIFATEGEFYSPAREYRMLQTFVDKKTAPFQNSVWRGRVLDRIRFLSGIGGQ